MSSTDQKQKAPKVTNASIETIVDTILTLLDKQIPDAGRRALIERFRVAGNDLPPSVDDIVAELSKLGIY
jgi:hypothetical protein